MHKATRQHSWKLKSKSKDFSIFKIHSFIHSQSVVYTTCKFCHSIIDYIIFLFQHGFLFLECQIIFKCLFQHYQLVQIQLFSGYQVLAQKHSFLTQPLQMFWDYNSRVPNQCAFWQSQFLILAKH